MIRVVVEFMVSLVSVQSVRLSTIFNKISTIKVLLWNVFVRVLDAMVKMCFIMMYLYAEREFSVNHGVAEFG